MFYNKAYNSLANVNLLTFRQDYHDFEAPLLTMLLVLASQALTDWTRRFDPFLYQIDLYLGPVRPVRCIVTPSF